MSDDIGSGTNTNGSLTIGQSVQSELLGYYDADWFKVTLEAGKIYQFTLNGNFGRGYPSGVVLSELQLMDASGKLLTLDYTTSASNSAQLSFVAGQSGSYFVGVASDYQYLSGTYTLLSAVQTQVPDDYAPNSGTTGVLAVGAAQQAKFESAGDIDWFKFHVDAGHTYKFSFARDAGLVMPDTYLIYDAQGVVQTNSFPFQPLASGDYYVSMQGGASTGNYAFTLNELADDYTANNAAPGQLDVGGMQTGVIQYQYDTDRFQVHLEQGKIYTFELSADSALQSHLSLRASDSSGNAITLSSLSNSNGAIKVIMTAPKDGVYSLDVIPDYQWTGTDGHYTLTSQPAIIDDVGNTLASATALGAGASLSGRIDAPGDIDMFKLNVTAGVSYTLTLDSATLDSGTGQITMSGVNAKGEVQSSLTQYSGNSYTFTPTATGAYYFALNGSSNALGSYTISTHYAVDDFAANASGAGQLSLDQPASGKIDFSGDRDWFSMALDAGATYWFTLSAGQSSDNSIPRLGRGDIHVVDANGRILASTSDAYNGFSTLSFTSAFKGTYYLEVVGANSSDGVGLYQLQVKPGVRDDYGNDQAHAAVLTPGTAKSGAIEVNGDVDVFKLSVTAGMHYGLQLQSSYFGGEIKVTDASGKAVSLSNYYAGSGQFAATTTGDYYVSVYAYSPPFGNATYKLNAIAYSADDVGETAATAGTLDANSRVQGVINFPDDKDWFKVHLEAGRSYSFDLLGLGDGSQYSASRGSFTLYDNHSGASNWNDTLGSSGGSGAPHLSYVASKTGDFYIEVHGGALGGYTLVDTVTSTDLTPPALVSMSPANGSSGFGLSSNIVMNFNELITLAPNVTMTLTDSNGRSYSFNSNNGNKGIVSGQTLTIDPSFNLQPGMSYTLHIGGGILDMAGNKAAIPDDITFSTVAASTSGTDGDDLFIGAGTGQQIQGGKGIDTVYYDNYPNTGHYASLYKNGNTFYVRGFGAATGDVLNGIERVIFSDHAVALDIDGHGGQAYRLYQAAFNRTPDQAGLGYWIAAMDKGVSLQAVAHGFATSAEFQSLYGAAPTDAQYVNQLYHNVLHRDGDAAGAAYWQDVLQHGHGRDEVLSAFSESAENQAALIGVIGNGITYIPQG